MQYISLLTINILYFRQIHILQSHNPGSREKESNYPKQSEDGDIHVVCQESAYAPMAGEEDAEAREQDDKNECKCGDPSKVWLERTLVRKT